MDLIEAVKQGRLDVVQNLCDQQGNANVDYQDEYGATALMWAAIHEHIDIFNELCKRGADVNLKDKHGRTALMFSVGCDDPQFVNLLFDRGANVNLKDRDGRTVLFHAMMTFKINIEIIEELCRRGAKVTHEIEFLSTEGRCERYDFESLFTKQRFNHKVLMLLRGRKLPIDLLKLVHEWRKVHEWI